MLSCDSHASQGEEAEPSGSPVFSSGANNARGYSGSSCTPNQALGSSHESPGRFPSWKRNSGILDQCK